MVEGLETGGRDMDKVLGRKGGIEYIQLDRRPAFVSGTEACGIRFVKFPSDTEMHIIFFGNGYTASDSGYAASKFELHVT